MPIFRSPIVRNCTQIWRIESLQISQAYQVVSSCTFSWDDSSLALENILPSTSLWIPVSVRENHWPQRLADKSPDSVSPQWALPFLHLQKFLEFWKLSYPLALWSIRVYLSLHTFWIYHFPKSLGSLSNSSPTLEHPLFKFLGLSSWSSLLIPDLRPRLITDKR